MPARIEPMPPPAPKPLRERLVRPIAEFAQAEASSGILLVVCTVIALFWANSRWAPSYFAVWETPVTFSFGEFRIDKTLLHWINDGLMAVFFLLVGLEIKREIVIGELATVRKAMLPITAAVGGMVVPALIYLAFNAGGPGVRGWGVPMATDIAFSLGVLALLGTRIPFSLKIFLAAFAIVDDIGAVVVIATFYTSELQWNYLYAAAAIVAGLAGLNRLGIRAPLAFVIPGVFLWICFLKSGVHATVAGVLLALTIPTRTRLDPAEFARQGREAIEEFQRAGDEGALVLLNEDRQSAVRALEKACERVQMPLERIEDALHPWITFFVMPLFALANAGVSLDGSGRALGGGVGLGIVFGLLVGKPVGIGLFAYIAVRLGLASLPTRVGMAQIIGVGVLGGIGFTMSLFIAELAFGESPLLVQAKVGILVGSLLAGSLGYAILRTRGRKRPRRIPGTP